MDKRKFKWATRLEEVLNDFDALQVGHYPKIFNKIPT